MAALHDGATPITLASEIPLVGRSPEKETLRAAIDQTKAGQGSAWLVEGPAGIGKTRLLRWLQEEAEGSGHRVLWANALKEVNTPFFPLEQLFRALGSVPGQGAGPSGQLPEELPAIVLFEEDRPRMAPDELARLSKTTPLLLVGRERPDAVRARLPTLDPSARLLWLSKGEGEDRFAPTDLDRLGDLLQSHLQTHPRGIVALLALDYLVSQNGYGPVLRLIQFVRDAAEVTEGHLFLALNPKVYSERELSLLEGEGHAVKAVEGPSGTAPSPETPTAVMIRYLEALERESSRRPLMLVLDDLQWADPPSLHAVQFLARNVRKLPVFFVAGLRNDEGESPLETRESSLIEVLDATEREGTLQRLPLGGLSKGEVVELAHGLFGPALEMRPADRETEELLRRSEGNPFFLKETLSQLATEGYVRRDGARLTLSVPRADRDERGQRPLIPDSLRRLVARRLERLSEEETEFLGWAAVLGSEFDLAPLEDMPISPASRALLIARDLAQREHLLRELTRDRWTFTHLLVWEVALAELTTAERTRRAERLAKWWVAHRPSEVDTVTRLYHDAMDAEEGIPWVRRSVEAALQSRSLELTERYHRWLQELLEAAGSSADARVTEGLAIAARVLQTTGPSREALRMLRALRALDCSSLLHREVEAYLVYAMAGTEPYEARTLLVRLREEILRPGISPEARAVVLLASARILAREGANEEAVAETAHILELEGSLPLWVRIRALYFSGISLSRLGRMDDARHRVAEAHTLAEPTHDASTLGYCQALEVFIAELAGEAAAQRRAVEATLILNRAAGGSLNIATSLSNLAVAYVVEGDLEGARRAVAEYRKHCERFGTGEAPLTPTQTRFEGENFLEGQIFLREQRWKESTGLLQRARDEMLQTVGHELLDETRLLLAEALLGTGDLPAARTEITNLRKDQEGLQAYLRPRLPMVEGRTEALEGRSVESRATFETARHLAAATGNLVNQGLAAGHLARWEETFGSPEKARELWSEAGALLDRSGVLPKAWARTWPPPFRGPEAGAG